MWDLGKKTGRGVNEEDKIGRVSRTNSSYSTAHANPIPRL